MITALSVLIAAIAAGALAFLALWLWVQNIHRRERLNAEYGERMKEYQS